MENEIGKIGELILRDISREANWNTSIYVTHDKLLNAEIVLYIFDVFNSYIYLFY